MDLQLRGKRAAVMAASQGLGFAAARALAREGARVALCARDGKRLAEAARGLAEETGAEVLALPADVGRAEEVASFVEAAAARFGGLDILVTNKGGPPELRFAELTDEQWRRSFDLIVMSYVWAVRAAVPHFRRAGGGAVVAIESTSVRQPIPQLPLSGALRSSVVALSKTLAAEHGPEGIRFSVVLPGSMDTERIHDLDRAVAREQGISARDAAAARVRATPLGRLGQPQELGDLVAYLASPRGAYITGSVFACDGGLVRGL